MPRDQFEKPAPSNKAFRDSSAEMPYCRTGDVVLHRCRCITAWVQMAQRAWYGMTVQSIRRNRARIEVSSIRHIVLAA
jgi:hypothetical protein